MSKKRSIGRMIHRGTEIKKLVTPNMLKAIKRRENLINELNTVIDNADDKFSSEQVFRAKAALRKIYARSQALTEKPLTNNKDSWRKGSKTPANGKQKIKRMPSQPKVEFKRK